MWPLRSSKKGQRQQAPPPSPPPPQQSSASSKEMPKGRNKSAEPAGDEKLPKTEEVAAKQKRDNDIATFEAQRDEYTELLKDKTLSPQAIARYEKERALAKWELAQLKSPNDLVQLEAARKALVDAAVEHAREKEKDEWTKTITNLEEKVENTTGVLKERQTKRLLATMEKFDDWEKSWPAKEIELIRHFEEKYPLSSSSFAYKLVEDCPDLESFQSDFINMHFALYPKKTLNANELPIGVDDGKVDMRLFPAERPAARFVGGILRKNSFGSRLYAMLAAVSGSGKTSVAFQLATELYTFYFVCAPSGLELPRASKHDPSTFPLLQEEAKNRVPTFSTKRERTEEARRIAMTLLVSHLYLLYHFLTMHPDGTPTQFLMCQLNLNQGPLIVSTAFEKLRKLSVTAVSSFAIVLRNAIEQKLPNQPLLLVIDEMESAAVVMTEHFISRQTTVDGFDKQGRGLLTPLLQAAGDLSVGGRFNLLVMGTGSVLARSASATSDIGKGELHKFHSEQFPMATKEEVHRMLISLLGVDEEVIGQVEEVSKYLYNARFRLLARTIEQFVVRQDEANLPERLKAAIQESVATHKKDLLRRLNERVSTTNQHLNQTFLDDLHDVYVSAILSGGKFISDQFSRLDTLVQDEGKREDWCRLGIAQVDDEHEFHVIEQFAFETICDFFEKRPSLVESLAFKQSIKDLERVIDRFQTTTAGKGDIFENIISHSLKSLKGMTVADLPFVQIEGSRHTAKKRWAKVRMNVDRVVRVPPLPNDAAFLANSAPGTLFSPTKAHRADGLSLFESGELLSFGAKLYSKAVPSTLTLSQYRSTDPSAAYELAEEKKPNPRAAADRTSWEQLRLHEKIAFRLHVNIPRSQLPFLDDANRKLLEPGTTILSDGSLVVNIDVSNVDQFFAGIKDKELRKSVYRLLYRITRAPELAELVK